MKTLVSVLVCMCMFSSCAQEVQQKPGNASGTSMAPAGRSEDQPLNTSNQEKQEEKKVELAKKGEPKVEEHQLTFGEMKKQYASLLQHATGATVWNEKSGKLGYVKEYTKADTIVTEVHVLDTKSKLDTVLATYTSQTGKDKEVERMHITLKEFSPSGVYLWYEKSGFEACEGVMQDAISKTKMSWDLFGCPRILWTSDAKQVVLLTPTGFFGPGKILVSQRGNIANLMNISTDSVLTHRIELYFERVEEAKLFVEGGKDRIRFPLGIEGEGEENVVMDVESGKIISPKS